MARPWNRILVQDEPGVGEVLDGRLFQGINVAMCDDDVEAIRQGYKCIQCYENLDESWPEHCPLCSFPIKTHQAEVFARTYDEWQPVARTGPDWDAIADRLEERAERRAVLSRAKESRIWLGSKRVGDVIQRVGKS